jgi:hypothetical protein
VLAFSAAHQPFENPLFPFENPTQAVLSVAGPSLAFTRQQYEFICKLARAPWFNIDHMPGYRYARALLSTLCGVLCCSPTFLPKCSTMRNLSSRLPTIPATSESVTTAQGAHALLYRRSLFDCLRQQLQFPGVLDSAECIWQAEKCAHATSPLHGHRARASPLFTLNSFINDNGEVRSCLLRPVFHHLLALFFDTQHLVCSSSLAAASSQASTSTCSTAST